MRFSTQKKWEIPVMLWKVLLCIGTVFCMLWFLELHVKPTLLALAEIRATAIATESIHKVIRKELDVRVNDETLLEVKLDQQGRVSFIQPNTVRFNQISAETALKVQEELKNLTQEQISIPFGQVLGNSLLANLGPSIQVKIIPAGTVQVEMVNKFESAGINQTKHMVYLTVTAEVKIVIPLVSKGVKVQTQVPVSEYVVVGEVPNTYLQIPIQQ